MCIFVIGDVNIGLTDVQTFSEDNIKLYWTQLFFHYIWEVLHWLALGYLQLPV